MTLSNLFVMTRDAKGALLFLDLCADPSPLTLNFFLPYPFLIELNLSHRRNVSYLPPSISQCCLLQRIDISWTSIPRPPVVLFSIPAFRADPSRIRFGSDQSCSPELAESIISDIFLLNQCVIKFEDPRGVRRRVSFSPDTTTATFVRMTFPSLSNIIPYLFLVRLCDTSVLRIVPDRTPMSLYLYPKARWYLELHYLPGGVPIPGDSIPLLKNLVDSRALYVQDSRLAVIQEQLNRLMGRSRDNELPRVVEEMRNCPLLTSIRSKIAVPRSGNATVAATNDWVAIIAGPASYYVFPTSQIVLTGYFDPDGQDTLLLKCGQRAVQIEAGDLYTLMPVLALAAPVSGIGMEEEPSEFRQVMIEALALYFAGSNERIKKPELMDDITVDVDEPVRLERMIKEFGAPNLGRRIRYRAKG
jgi:hypothetical protein